MLGYLYFWYYLTVFDYLWWLTYWGLGLFYRSLHGPLARPPGGGHSHWKVIWVCAAYKTHLFTLISSSGDPQFHVNLPLRSP